MALEENPYATPQAAEVIGRDAQVDQNSYYVEGKRLIVRDDAQLPNICIHTGAMDYGKRRKKVFYWSFGANKKCTVHYCASPKALMKRRGIIALFFLFLIASIPSIFYGLSAGKDNPSLLILGIGGFMASIIMISLYSSPFRAKKHIDGWFSLAGAHKEFLRKVSEEHQICKATSMS